MRRLPFIFLTILVVGCGGLSSKQRSAADESVKALRKIAAATEVGVNYQTYGQLLIDAKAKVNEAKDVLLDGDLKTEMNAAMDSYGDAATVWGTKIQNQGYFYEIGETKPITDKYKLQEIAKNNLLIDGDIVIKIIWAEARTHLEKADTLLKK